MPLLKKQSDWGIRKTRLVSGLGSGGRFKLGLVVGLCTDMGERVHECSAVYVCVYELVTSMPHRPHT